jgi:putative phage-type endonuclease
MSLSNGYAHNNGQHRPKIVAMTIDGRGLTQEEWLAERSRDYGIGSSDMPVIAGLTGSALKLWYQKKGLYPPEAETEPMWWGKKLEPLIAERLEIDHGIQLEYRQIFHRHPKLSWLFATIDGIDSNGGLVEIKSTGLFGQDEEERGLSFDEKNPPAKWIVQAHAQMFVAGGPEVRVPVFYGPELALKQCFVQRNDELCGHLVELATDFRASLIKDVPPRAAHPSDVEIMAKLFKRIDGPPLDWSTNATLCEAVGQYHEANEAKKTWTKARESLKASLLQAIGSSQLAIVPGYRLKRSVSKVGAVSLDVKSSDVQSIQPSDIAA